MPDQSRKPDLAYIVERLNTNDEIKNSFIKAINQAPEEIDWGSDTDFEIRWAELVKEAEKIISLEFPDTDKQQRIEAVRMFALKISQK